MLILEARFLVARVGLELYVVKDGLNSWPPCLQLLSKRITKTHSYVQFSLAFITSSHLLPWLTFTGTALLYLLILLYLSGPSEPHLLPPD